MRPGIYLHMLVSCLLDLLVGLVNEGRGGGERNRQTDRQTDRQAGRQAGRQTGRQIER